MNAIQRDECYSVIAAEDSKSIHRQAQVNNRDDTFADTGERLKKQTHSHIAVPCGGCTVYTAQTGRTRSMTAMRNVTIMSRLILCPRSYLCPDFSHIFKAFFP